MDASTVPKDAQTLGGESRTTYADNYSVMTPLFTMEGWLWPRAAQEGDVRDQISQDQESDDGSSQGDDRYGLNDYSTVDDSTEFSASSSYYTRLSKADTDANTTGLSITETYTEDRTMNFDDGSEEDSFQAEGFSRSGGSSVLCSDDLRTVATEPSNDGTKAIKWNKGIVGRLRQGKLKTQRSLRSIDGKADSLIKTTLNKIPDEGTMFGDDDEYSPKFCNRALDRAIERLKIQPTTYDAADVTETPSDVGQNRNISNTKDSVEVSALSGESRGIISGVHSTEPKNSKSYFTTVKKKGLKFFSKRTLPTHHEEEREDVCMVASNAESHRDEAVKSTTNVEKQNDNCGIEMTYSVVKRHLESSSSFDVSLANQQTKKKERDNGCFHHRDVCTNDETPSLTNEITDRELVNHGHEELVRTKSVVRTRSEVSEVKGYEVTLMDLKDLKRKGRIEENSSETITQKCDLVADDLKTHRSHGMKSFFDVFRRDEGQQLSINRGDDSLMQYEDHDGTHVPDCQAQSERHLHGDMGKIHDSVTTETDFQKQEGCIRNHLDYDSSKQGEDEEKISRKERFAASSLKHAVDVRKRTWKERFVASKIIIIMRGALSLLPKRQVTTSIPTMLPVPKSMSSAPENLSIVVGNADDGSLEEDPSSKKKKKKDEELKSFAGNKNLVIPTKLTTPVTATSWTGVLERPKSMERKGGVVASRNVKPTNRLSQITNLASSQPYSQEYKRGTGRDGDTIVPMPALLEDTADVSWKANQPILERDDDIESRSVALEKRQQSPTRHFSFTTGKREKTKVEGSADLSVTNHQSTTSWYSRDSRSRTSKQSQESESSRQSKPSIHSEVTTKRQNTQSLFSKFGHSNRPLQVEGVSLRQMVTEIKAEKVIAKARDGNMTKTRTSFHDHTRPTAFELAVQQSADFKKFALQ